MIASIITFFICLEIFRFAILNFYLVMTKVVLLILLNFLSVFHFFEKAFLAVNALAL